MYYVARKSITYHGRSILQGEVFEITPGEEHRALRLWENGKAYPLTALVKVYQCKEQDCPRQFVGTNPVTGRNHLKEHIDSDHAEPVPAVEGDGESTETE